MSKQLSAREAIDAQVDMTFAAYGRTATGAAKAAWFEACATMPTDIVVEAFRVCRHSYRQLPSIADVLEEARGLQAIKLTLENQRREEERLANATLATPEETAKALAELKARMGW